MNEEKIYNLSVHLGNLTDDQAIFSKEDSMAREDRRVIIGWNDFVRGYGLGALSILVLLDSNICRLELTGAES